VASNITFEQEIEEKLKAQGFELSALSKDLKLYFDTNRAKKPK
jgi:predicted fused transcriptional regulator/phosphomethylpyrimidine kinase